MKYSMRCTCGDVVTVDAANKEEAIEKIKGMLGEDYTQKHMAEKHPGEPVPTPEQIAMMVEQGVVEGELPQNEDQPPAA